MSNIDRKYDYHDDGVLPAQGEYGVTYLTLYSSGAGNAYDGWIWDPDRINYSETARTFGYRNPSYPDYCWDDEVVVDLSNAQTRQESSDFEQGRITSFNTNVSNVPIVINDIDVTGMTEDEREAKATTILFTAIPLVKDSYIHAEVEVQMKMNLSPNNTTGNIRVEAFYILNDESDRTMRPHPVNHYTVTRDDEYNILRLLYWNPALKHEVSNYIGVKLIVTGGTVEIGISDNPEYGDAIITVSSAGMTGDNIFDDIPVSLSITGKTLVPYGYLFDPNDYEVLCEYSNGDVYDVTKMCDYVPAPGEAIIAPVKLVAMYTRLSASLQIEISPIVAIELSGITQFYSECYFDLNNYTVMALFENGDEIDVTYDCTYNIAEGTLITEDTTLTAELYVGYMGQTFTDSLNIVKINSTARVTAHLGGLIYTLYDHESTDGLIEITGDAHRLAGISPDTVYDYDHWTEAYDSIAIPSDIWSYIYKKHVSSNRHDGKEMTYVLKWSAKGPVSGVYIPAYGSDYGILDRYSKPKHRYEPSQDVSAKHRDGLFCKRLIDFKKIKIRPKFEGLKKDEYSPDPLYNQISLSFYGQEYLTNNDLSFLYNDIDFRKVSGIPALINPFNHPIGEDEDHNHIYEAGSNYGSMFAKCHSLVSISFLSNWPLDVVRYAVYTDYMFYELENISDFSCIKRWYLPKVINGEGMFCRSGIRYSPFTQLYLGSKSIDYTYNSPSYTVNVRYMFAECDNLTSFPSKILLGESTHYYSCTEMFINCVNLTDISRISELSGIRIGAIGMFCNTSISSGVGSLNTLLSISICKAYTGEPYDGGYFDYDPQGSGGQVVHDNYPPFIGYRNCDRFERNGTSNPPVMTNVLMLKKLEYHETTRPELTPNYFQFFQLTSHRYGSKHRLLREYAPVPSGAFQGLYSVDWDEDIDNKLVTITFTKGGNRIPDWYKTLIAEAIFDDCNNGYTYDPDPPFTHYQITG